MYQALGEALGRESDTAPPDRQVAGERGPGQRFLRGRGGPKPGGGTAWAAPLAMGFRGWGDPSAGRGGSRGCVGHPLPWHTNLTGPTNAGFALQLSTV